MICNDVFILILTSGSRMVILTIQLALRDVINTYQYNLLLNKGDYDWKNYADRGEWYSLKLKANMDNSLSTFLTMAMCEGMDCTLHNKSMLRLLFIPFLRN